MYYVPADAPAVDNAYTVWFVSGRAPECATGYRIVKLRAGFVIKVNDRELNNGYVFASVAHALGWLNSDVN